MTDEAIFFSKKIRGLNEAQNEVFRDFVEFQLLVVLVAAYSDSLQQCLISSRGKTHEKKLGTQIWAKRAKIGPEIRFFAIASSLFHEFS